MGQADDIKRQILTFAESLDSCLDAPDGNIHERIILMQARDSLRQYGGLHDVGRCRKVIERLPGELERCGFHAELLVSVRRSCQRVVAVLRKV